LIRDDLAPVVGRVLQQLVSSDCQRSLASTAWIVPSPPPRFRLAQRAVAPQRVINMRDMQAIPWAAAQIVHDEMILGVLISRLQIINSMSL